MSSHRLRALVPAPLRRWLVQTVAGRQLAERAAEIASLSRRLDQAEVDVDEARRSLGAATAETAQLRSERAAAEKAWTGKLERARRRRHRAVAAAREELTRTHRDEVAALQADARNTLGDAQRRAAAVETAARQSIALLRLNAPDESRAAMELLQSALGSRADRKAVSTSDADERLRRLRALAASEQNPGRWTSLLRTEFTAARTGAAPEDTGFLLVSDTRTQNNIGCRVTTTGLIAALERHGARISHTITLAEIQDMGASLRRLAEEPPAAANFDVHKALIGSHPEFAALRTIASASRGVVINAEGGIYDKQPKGLFILVLASVFADVLGKPTAIVNYSADLSHPVMESWARQSLPTVAWSAFREHHSALRLPGDFPELPGAGWIPDAAFLVDVGDRDDGGAAREIALGQDSLLARPIDEPYAVITGSSSLFRQDRAATDIVEPFTALCADLRRRGLHPVLWEADKQDRVLLRTVALELGLPYMSAAVPQETLRHVLSGASCMLSGRWHASILAARWGCPPLLGDANFFKTDALHELLGLATPMFSYRELATSRVIVADAMLAAAAGAEDANEIAARAAALADRAEHGLATVARRLVDISA